MAGRVAPGQCEWNQASGWWTGESSSEANEQSRSGAMASHGWSLRLSTPVTHRARNRFERVHRGGIRSANSSSSARASAVGSGVGSVQSVRDHLLGLIAGEERGLRTRKNARKREEIVKAIDALADLASEKVTTGDSLTAAWRMLWTTEKEQLFIVEKATLFGTEAGDILQIIDVAKNSLRNVITFPPTGLFLVDSSIEVVSPQRVNFKFNGASLKVGDLRIPIPPFGQGWFESVYLDDKIRVAKDIRGDYLIVDRASSIPEGL